MIAFETSCRTLLEVIGGTYHVSVEGIGIKL